MLILVLKKVESPARTEVRSLTPPQIKMDVTSISNISSHILDEAWT